MHVVVSRWERMRRGCDEDGLSWHVNVNVEARARKEGSLGFGVTHLCLGPSTLYMLHDISEDNYIYSESETC